MVEFQWEGGKCLPLFLLDPELIVKFDIRKDEREESVHYSIQMLKWEGKDKNEK